MWYIDYLSGALTWKYIIVSILFLLLVILEIQLLRTTQFMLKIACVERHFYDNFIHSIDVWETKWLPVSDLLFSFPVTVVIGYYTPIILNGAVRHFFPIDILRSNAVVSSPLIIIILGFVFLSAAFVTEADSGIPQIIKILETIRTTMKDMVGMAGFRPRAAPHEDRYHCREVL